MANNKFSDNFCLYPTHSSLTIKNPNVEVSMIINTIAQFSKIHN